MKPAGAITTAAALITASIAGCFALVVAGNDQQPAVTATIEIPPPLLARYRTETTCRGVDWSIIAAVGWVESRHANNTIDPATGTLTGPIIRGGTPVGPDTDHGRLDGDPAGDWAVGLMQLTPTTWTANATRAGSQPPGPPDIANAWDEIATANHYLCRLVSDSDGDLRRALAGYNCGPNRAATCGATYANQVLAKAAAYRGPITTRPAASLEGDVGVVVATAVAQVGKPYVFGARGPDAFDCSGLVAYAYHAAGIELPAYTFTLVGYGTPVPVDAIRPGDLLFSRGGSPPEDFGHVAIAVTTSSEVVAPRTGLTITITPIVPDHVQAVRRIVAVNAVPVAAPAIA